MIVTTASTASKGRNIGQVEWKRASHRPATLDIDPVLSLDAPRRIVSAA
jgi:hypothetical protein